MALINMQRLLPVSGKSEEYAHSMDVKKSRKTPANWLIAPQSEDYVYDLLHFPGKQPQITAPLYTNQLHQEPGCIDIDTKMEDSYAPDPSELTHLGNIPSLIFDHTYDQIKCSEIDQMDSICSDTGFGVQQVYCESNVYGSNPASVLSFHNTLQASYLSADSAISGCESRQTSPISICDSMQAGAISYYEETGIQSEIQHALAYPLLPKFPDHRVPELLGGGLDRLLPMEKVTILVTHKDYSIFRYWTQQDTIFGNKPDCLQAKSIECVLNPKCFYDISNHQRTESFEECILFCGDRIKVMTSAGKEQWMTFWMKESKIDDEDHYTFVFIDNCVPIATIQIDETGRITEYPMTFEESDLTDYIDARLEQLQGHDYRLVFPTIDSWYRSKHGVHYFISREQSSVDIIAVPSITGLVSVYYDKTIAWCSEMLSCCLFGLTPEQAVGRDIIYQLPQCPSVIDSWITANDWIESGYAPSIDDGPRIRFHGVTLMYEWCRSKLDFRSSPKSDQDHKPSSVACNGTGETQVELYVKFSSQENVPHWVFVKNLSEWGTTLSDYKVLENSIGQGSYGSVYTAYDRRSLGKVTIKYVDRSRVIRENNRKKKSLPVEIEVLKLLQENAHPNCIEMFTYFDDSQYYYIVMGNYGKTLYSFIEENQDLPEQDSQHIFKQIAAGVHHLHEKLNIVHRDLKDENIMIDDQRRVRLIDFGSAAILKTKGRKFNAFVGTVDYAAPEVLSGQPYTGKPQDVWALGIILYTIIHHSNPFNSAAEIIGGEMKFPFPLDYDLRGLIVGMLNISYKVRLTIQEVVSHKWLSKEFPVAHP